ncbi:hypothetical protein CROQUDRAFT_656145 [Cronartium quercuum f. sp. fusiforme G11]|uniref:Secreted protein n=1 Tax=Cronartium quercuum f. sp. fusiforme G11 TaxID=708437 RepID=A0A9P6NNJ8_9BASI|nr:hypothetical protein CROQUDRAFT_656145 [Cronartium quercuum f. sp. fusiforme G11]
MLLPSSLPILLGLLALLILSVGSRELLIRRGGARARRAEEPLHWALYGQYCMPPSIHDGAIHVPTWNPPSCRLVTRFYPHELVELWVASARRRHTSDASQIGGVDPM